MKLGLFLSEQINSDPYQAPTEIDSHRDRRACQALLQSRAVKTREIFVEAEVMFNSKFIGTNYRFEHFHRPVVLGILN